jgi:hypothetical protein
VTVHKGLNAREWPSQVLRWFDESPNSEFIKFLEGYVPFGQNASLKRNPGSAKPDAILPVDSEFAPLKYIIHDDNASTWFCAQGTRNRVNPGYLARYLPDLPYKRPDSEPVSCGDSFASQNTFYLHDLSKWQAKP